MRAGRAVPGAFSVLVCVAALGCATTDVMRIDQQSRPPTKAADVQVFVEEPKRAYASIAIIQASDQGWGLSLETLKQKMVERAAELGGDAVILGQQTTRSGGTYFMPIGNVAYGVDMPEKNLAGKVIVFSK